MTDIAAVSKETATGFFPQEMDEEKEDKNNASQKRQIQRDQNRSRRNPNRSQEDERGERERKSEQARSRGNRCADPSEPGCGNKHFDRNREAGRESRCSKTGGGCDYGRTRNDPNPRRNTANKSCIEKCYDRGATNCNRKCGELTNVEDVELMAKFFEENVNAMAIAGFLFDVYGDEDSEDSYDEDSDSADNN